MMAAPFSRPPWRAIDAALSELVGRPFSRGARGPAAFDCWGLVLEVRARLGLPLPPDFASGELARDAVHALFLTERPEGWRRGDLTLGGIVLATDAAHAGIHLAGRILHASRRGVVAWSLGHWSANFGALECWEAV
jgi:cell wall-associated NlpC family hydrolase